MKLFSRYKDKIAEAICTRLENFIENHINKSLAPLKMAAGRIETRQIQQTNTDNIQKSEFQVFSQWGEDGIIQYLINKIPVENKIFVEFGVENYLESNTRFLLQNNNWSGLVIDGSQENIKFIKSDDIYWKHNLKAEQAFVTSENINTLISNAGLSGDIGLLSVDVDGNDYWIWKSIDVINPRIVICEYNSLWGAYSNVSIPYEPDFIRSQKHYSYLYFGASVAAFTSLAEEKGYFLVGSNKAGNNLFFVRKDVIGDIKTLSPEEAFEKSMFRESRDKSGNLTYAEFENRLEIIKDMPVYDFQSKQTIKVSDIKFNK